MLCGSEEGAVWFCDEVPPPPPPPPPLPPRGCGAFFLPTKHPADVETASDAPGGSRRSHSASMRRAAERGALLPQPPIRLLALFGGWAWTATLGTVTPAEHHSRLLRLPDLSSADPREPSRTTWAAAAKWQSHPGEGATVYVEWEPWIAPADVLVPGERAKTKTACVPYRLRLDQRHAPTGPPITTRSEPTWKSSVTSRSRVHYALDSAPASRKKSAGRMAGPPNTPCE